MLARILDGAEPGSPTEEALRLLSIWAAPNEQQRMSADRAEFSS